MKNKEKRAKLTLLACNIILIVLTIAGAVLYSRYITRTRAEAQKEDFIRTIESMKQVSRNYLNSERGYVKDWAAYISEHDMSLSEALDFLRTINTDKERYAHIVDMDTYEAYSAYYAEEKEKIDTYLKYKDKNVESEEPFASIMETMFNGSEEEFAVLGKYRLQETQAMAVAIGTRVTLSVENGRKDYLLLRIIPTETMKKSWVFPMEYSTAEVGIITHAGDYVIQSSSMKSLNFSEYIRAYNFQDDYNQVQKLKDTLRTTDRGILSYKNYRGTDCLWYYSSFGGDSSLDILGVINEEELQPPTQTWYIVFLVCGVIFVLAVIDGIYLVGINRKLREAARLSEQASRAKTQFLSAMSHDIRTPLNAVLGMMTIARKKAEDPQCVTECMDKGIHAGRQLLTLINDVLDISKIESGKITLNREQVSIDEIISGLTEMLEQNMAQKKIELVTDFTSLPYKFVYADGMRLNQIYVNLLTNAVKYTEEGGRITLRLYEEDLPEKPHCTRLVFYVEDTGIGMTEEFQKRMYSTFAREVKTQVNSTQGSGLGLSIVKQMVDLMGGTIVCKSASGEGTAFTVCIDLPVVEHPDQDSIPAETVQTVDGLHLLIAEDNELNWEIIRELLSEKGITCDRAENGKTCLQKLLHAPAGTYQAILMDVHMPVMNGLETTRAVRSLENDVLKHIPIIAMTADAFAEDVRMCMEAGMNGHVAKPVDMDKLMIYLTKIKNVRI